MRNSRKNLNPCIYKITCLSNNKIYIGSAIDTNKHANRYLQFA